MPNILSIIKEQKCYGCEACYNTCPIGAISIRKGSQGFYEPAVDLSKCINCGKCDKNCPAFDSNLSQIKNQENLSVVYSARLKNTTVRKISSSGGAFSAISDYVLNNGGYVAGVVWNQDFTVKHIVTLERDQRDLMRSSKYIQSRIGNCYQIIRDKLVEGKLVLFTGTPCQNAALKLFLSNIDTEKLILCDVLCGGNVSPGLFNGYLKYIESIKKDKVEAVCFRTKKIGWKQHHIRINMNNGIYEGARRENEPFFVLYLKKYIIRNSCFNCKFASIERITDITLGDFWGIDKVDPDIDDDLGISFVSVNTRKGMDVIEKVTASMDMEERNIELAIPRQINLRQAPRRPERYDEFWTEYCSNGPEYVLKKYTIFGFRNMIINRLKMLVKKRKS